MVLAVQVKTVQNYLVLLPVGIRYNETIVHTQYFWLLVVNKLYCPGASHSPQLIYNVILPKPQLPHFSSEDPNTSTHTSDALVLDVVVLGGELKIFGEYNFFSLEYVVYVVKLGFVEDINLFGLDMQRGT